MTFMIAVAALPLVVALVVYGFRDPPHRLLPLYAASLPFGVWLSLPIGLPESYGSLSSLTGFALIVALSVGLLSARTPGRQPVDLPPAAPVWLLLLAVCVASALWSIDPGATLAAAFKLAALVLMFVLLAFSHVDRSAVTRTEHAAVIGGVVASVIGLYQAVTDTLPLEPTTGIPRFGQDMIGDNDLAAALLIPLAIAMWRATSGSALHVRALHAVAAVAMLAGIVLTGSRGGLVGAAVVLLVVTLYARRRVLLVVGGGAAVLAVVGVLLLSPGGIGERQLSDDDNGRGDITNVGMDACPTYCLTGAGWGTFQDVYEERQSKTPDARVIQSGLRWHAHNNWLQILVEVGVAGAVLMTVGFVLAVRDGLRVPRVLRGASLAALLAVLATGITLTNFEFKYFWFALIYVMLVRKAHEVDGPDLVTAGGPARADDRGHPMATSGGTGR